MSLFDKMHEEDRRISYGDWRPDAPPEARGEKEIIIDFETDGLKWWNRIHNPGGLGYFFPESGRTGYLPWAHVGDPCNLDLSAIQRWFQHEVKGLRITNASTRFEVHMAQNIDVSLEDLGCEVSDIQHHAALLNDKRKRFSLEDLCKDFLPDEKKVLTVNGELLDGSRMMTYPAGMVAVRAMADVRQVNKLKNIFWPQLTEQDLHRVRQLEDECIYATCEMERNGAPIDVELLNTWCIEAKARLEGYLRVIKKNTGIDFYPASAGSWKRLLERANLLGQVELTASGNVTTQYAVLSQLETDDESVLLALKAMKLQDLKSDYLDKYQKTVGADGILRFALHQLRGDEGGTITGRFASSGIKIGKEKIGANIQQVPDVRKSVDKGHDAEFPIRRLFVAGFDESGVRRQFLSADAAQIEYRMFASYARRAEVLEAYAKDPDTSFHKLVHALILPYMPELSYEHCKNINFMKLYGGGLTKLALMMGHITAREAAELKMEFAPKAPPRNHPMLEAAADVDDMYGRQLPEVRGLTNQMIDAANRRGYVTDLLGRRIRFEIITDKYGKPQAVRGYKALNGVMQGGAGSVMKRKMITAHRARKRIGLIPRMTVHDELTGDALSPETKQLLKDLLNVQEFPQLVVPIRWDVKTGANWAEC